ncbi:MAG: ATP-binding cassette domain-containing protein [Desulfobacterales bacterium]|nr:ATP-binding cassette domain-containing protein [Desulfobacterales bacterium]
MENHTMLSLQGVGKKFCRGLRRSLVYGTLDTAKTVLGICYDTTALRKEEFWALKNITIDLNKGTALGVIGSNGAGKSTLLRLISGILTPDCGRIAVRGRVGSLIALGAGFHPHLSGRENIVLNGAVMGMGKAEIDAHTDEIIYFADIGEFIDAPVSKYSSGMRVRLGFSIAIHSSPDILIIDEVLAVGDAQFMKKSFARLESLIKDKGVTAVVVSHNMGTIQRLCAKSLVLDKGEAKFLGDTDLAVSYYYESILGHGDDDDPGQRNKLIHHRDCGMDIHADDFTALDENGLPSNRLLSGRPATFVVHVQNKQADPVAMPTVSLLILNIHLTDLYALLQLPLSLVKRQGLIKDRVRVACRVPYLGIAPGRYKIVIKVGSQEEGVYDSAMAYDEIRVGWPPELMEQTFSSYSDFKCVMPTEWEFLE